MLSAPACRYSPKLEAAHTGRLGDPLDPLRDRLNLVDHLTCISAYSDSGTTVMFWSLLELVSAQSQGLGIRPPKKVYFPFPTAQSPW